MDFTPSPQQQAIFDWVENGGGSAFVEAVAGSGKTTTLIEACRLMAGPDIYISFAAFNKKIADEISAKLGPIGGARVATFHSFGFNAWRRHLGPNARVSVDANGKTDMMLDAAEVPDEYRSAVTQLVSIGKQSVAYELWDPDTDLDVWQAFIDRFDILSKVSETGESDEDVREEIIDYAVGALDWSRGMGSKIIDFDDMLWLPLVHQAKFFRVDWLLIDEAQDTNPARRLMARRMLKRSGRSVWVGDRNQAIYGFTGADADAVDLIVKEFECTLLPLTVSYRCPRAVVELAQTWVPHIEAHESAPEGSVESCSAERFEQRYIRGLDADETAHLLDNSADAPLHPGDAILCRNTRPLVSLAFRLIRAGIGCHVEGREIGKGLTALARRWKVQSVDALGVNLEAYREREIKKLTKRGAGAGYAIEALNDRVDTLFVIMDGCETVQEVVKKIGELFADARDGQSVSRVILSTIHKAKGREWDRVFILGFEKYMPSPYARQEWEVEQERNLMYVAVTRTKDRLVLTAALEEEQR